MEENTPLVTVTDNMDASAAKYRYPSGAKAVFIAFTAAMTVNAVVQLLRGDYVIAVLCFILTIWYTVTTLKSFKNVSDTNIPALMGHPNIFDFYGEYYINTDRISRAQIRYDWLVKIKENDHAYYLYIEPNIYHYIPKSAVPPEKAELLRQLIYSCSAKNDFTDKA